MGASDWRLYMRYACDYLLRMASMIQIRNVPDDLHRKMKARAALEGKSLSEYLLAELRRIAELPTPEEWRARLATREPVSPTLDAAEAVRAERDSR
jgi:plasmid stability protein